MVRNHVVSILVQIEAVDIAAEVTSDTAGLLYSQRSLLDNDYGSCAIVRRVVLQDKDSASFFFTLHEEDDREAFLSA